MPWRTAVPFLRVLTQREHDPKLHAIQQHAAVLLDARGCWTHTDVQILTSRLGKDALKLPWGVEEVWVGLK